MAAKLDDDKATRVKRQVEFYFSDSNAPRDKFLLEQIQADPEGYVDLSIVCKFSRMQAILFPRSTFDKDRSIPETLIKQVGESLKDCTSLQIDADATRVRRATELDPEAAVKGVDERSLYAAPFPFDATMEQLSIFWSGVAAVNGVRLRRHAVTKDFRGSVFVEFSSKEIMQEVQQKSLTYAHAPLRTEPKLDFMQRKKEDRSTGLLHETAPDYEPPAEEAQKPADPPASGSGATAAAADGPAQASASSAPAPEPAAQQPGPGPDDFEPGSVVQITFAAEPKLHFKDIQTHFGARDKGVRFVELKAGDEGQKAVIRFDKPESAQAALDTKDAEGKITVNANSGAAILLEGEPEKELYRGLAAKRAENEQNGGGSGRGRGRKRPFDGGGRGRGGRGRGRGVHVASAL